MGLSGFQFRISHLMILVAVVAFGTGAYLAFPSLFPPDVFISNVSFTFVSVENVETEIIVIPCSSPWFWIILTGLLGILVGLVFGSIWLVKKVVRRWKTVQ